MTRAWMGMLAMAAGLCGCAERSEFRLASDGAVDAPVAMDMVVAPDVLVDDVADDTPPVDDMPIASCDPPDGALCSPVGSRGCTAGRGCYVTPTTRLCTLGGTAGWLESCASPSACRPGFVCYFGQCNKTCCGDSDCTDAASGGRPNTYCLRDSSGVFEYGLCLTTMCDRQALTDNGCPRSMPYCGFSPTTRMYRCVGHTVVPPRADGEPCRPDNDCIVGYVCASPTGTDFACRRACNVNTAPLGGTYACPSGFECGRVGALADGSGACVPQ